MLVAEGQRAAVEFLDEVGADLAALVAGEAGIADALLAAIEAADAELEAVGQRRADPAVETVELGSGAIEDAGVAGDRIAGAAGDVVDHAAGGVRIEDRRRAATDDFDPVDRFVETEGLVGVQIAERGIVLHGQAVLEQVDRTEAVDRNAARADIARAFAARGLDPEAGDRLQRLGHARRRARADHVVRQGGDGVAGVELGALAGAGAAGDDDLLVGRGGAGGRAGGFLCLGERRNARRQQEGGEAGARQHMADLHW